MSSLGSPLALALGGDDSFDAGLIDHVQAAIDRLPTQFKGKPNIEGLLGVFAGPANDLELMWWQLILLRAVDTAEGTALDLIGKLVGQTRDGRFDDDYRRFIKARITSRRSSGLLETVIRVARLVLDAPATTIRVRLGGSALVMFLDLAATDDTIAGILLGFLKSTVAAGVRPILEYSPSDPSVWLDFDDDTDTLDDEEMISAIA